MKDSSDIISVKEVVRNPISFSSRSKKRGKTIGILVTVSAVDCLEDHPVREDLWLARKDPRPKDGEVLE